MHHRVKTNVEMKGVKWKIKNKKQKNKWRDEKGEISEMNNRAAVA